jgi:hypothetical protein
MLEEGIRFSSYSLKLTTVFGRYLSLAIALAREDIKLHLQAPQTKTEHFRFCVCVGELSSFKIASLLENIWTTGCTWLPKMST